MKGRAKREESFFAYLKADRCLLADLWDPGDLGDAFDL